MKTEPDHEFQKGLSLDDNTACLVCREQGVMLDGVWQHASEISPLNDAS